MTDDADTDQRSAPFDALTVHERLGRPREPETGLGRYDLGEILGRGGMGEVISARDEYIGREVAIKRMRSEDPSAASVARFLREARIQGQLEHPAIVPIHELSRDGKGLPYFVMKQLAGITLADVIRALGEGDPDTEDVFTRQKLLRALVEICLAVEFAHSHNIVHRDLKPANIMLGDFGEVHVLDWGIARAIHDAPERASAVDVATLDTDQTAVGTTLGTPGYMAPEQLRGEADLDGRADVYALGCLLFEILTLRALHPRGAPTAPIDHTPSKRAPSRDIPPELDAIVLAATMDARDDRYASARELADALERFLDGDRDIAFRKRVAQAELETARRSEQNDRPSAIRAAARALALDPENRAAADLIGRCMLEPPKVVPPEVESAIDSVDLDTLYTSRKLIAGSGLVLFAFLPVLAWMGFRDLWILGGAGVCGLIIASCAIQRRERMVPAARLSLVGVTLAIALIATILSPFLVAPGLAAVAGMGMATHPKVVRPQLLAIVLAAAVFGPWLLELAGISPSTISIAGDTIVIHAAAALGSTATIVGLVLYVMMLMLLAIAFGAAQTHARRTAQRAVQLQTWQLGQLVQRPS